MSEKFQVVHPMINFLVSEIREIKLLYDQQKFTSAWSKMVSTLDLIIPDLTEDRRTKAINLREVISQSVNFVSNQRGIHVQDTYSRMYQAQKTISNKKLMEYSQEFMAIVWPYLKMETYGGMVYATERSSQ